MDTLKSDILVTLGKITSVSSSEYAIMLADQLYEKVLEHERPLRAMLAKYQWQHRDFGDRSDFIKSCPECCGFESVGHLNSCELARLLRFHEEV